MPFQKRGDHITTNDFQFRVQPNVQAFAESLGVLGHRWLDALPAIIGQQCQAWSLELRETLPGGSRSHVCRVIRSDGGRAVLKLALPEPGFETQMLTLMAAQGRGYVKVFAHDMGNGAFLLESLGSPIHALVHDVPAVLTVTAETLLQAWQVKAESLPVLAATEHKAASLLALVQGLATKLGLEAVQAVDLAVRFAHQRLEARHPERQVVVHGDPHTENLLQVEQARVGAESGFVFVDPEGFVCEPEYDLGVAVRDWNAELSLCNDPRVTLRGWCEQLAEQTATDAEAIWQWAYLERVSTGLYLQHHGLPHLGRPFLAMASELA
jgi:streptomycin 6-kinase